MYKTKGVPNNFRHKWKYTGLWDETKVRPGLWKFNFRATKGKRSTKMGSFGVGTTGVWDIRARQYIRKTGLGRYQTEMIGTKRPLKFNVKKPFKRKLYGR